MKNIIVILTALLVSTFAMQSCTQPDNTAALNKIDSLALAKLDAYRHSLDSACMADVMAQARLKADSMMQASMKKSSGKSSTKKTTTSTGGAPTSVSDREGSQQGQPKSVTDRQGTKEEGPKSVKDRSGATQTPPKQ